MKIAVYSTFVRWTPHYETELEIIQKHIDLGDEVHHYVCNRELGICDQIIDHRFSEGGDPLNNFQEICNSCIAKRLRGSSLLSKPVNERPVCNTVDQVEECSLADTIETLDELRALKFENYDLGESIVSSLISHLRDPQFKPGTQTELIRRLIKSCINTYKLTSAAIGQESYDRVYVFNGRFSASRAVLRACQTSGTECFVHERGANIHKYELFRNVTPHDLAHHTREITRHWDQELDNEKKVLIGSSFFTERMKGVEQSWYSFVADQENGLLPQGWDPTKTNIVIFNSSEDEYAAIGREWKNPLYDNQLVAIQKILDETRVVNDPRIRLYLRVHPNLKNIDNEYMRALYALESDKITIVKPDSVVSSYEMLMRCSKVLTFASTIGIEAVYWGKPSILAGISLYRSMGATYNPESHEELVNMLLGTLSPKDKMISIKYGYYMSTYGIDFQYFKADGVFEGRFKGVNLADSPRLHQTLSLINLFRKIWRRIMK